MPGNSPGTVQPPSIQDMDGTRTNKPLRNRHKSLSNPLSRCQLHVQVVICVSDQPATDWRLPWRPPWAVLICQDGAQNSEKHWTSQSDGRDAWGKVWGKDVELPGPLSAPLSPNLCMFTNFEVLQSPSFGVFVEVSSCRHGWLNQWSLVIKLNLHPHLPPRSSKPSNHIVGNQPTLWWHRGSPKVTILTKQKTPSHLSSLR